MFKMNLSATQIPRGIVPSAQVSGNISVNGNLSLASRGFTRATAQLNMNIANLKTTRGCGCGK
jgi:hypothetical protein